MSREERAADFRACRAQVFLGHARDPRIRNAVHELPQVVLDSRTELPGKPAALVLLLVNVAEGRLDVRFRDAEAAANDWRTLAGTLRGEAIREITKQKVEAV